MGFMDGVEREMSRVSVNELRARILGGIQRGFWKQNMHLSDAETKELYEMEFGGCSEEELRANFLYYFRQVILGDHDRMCQLCRQIVPDGQYHQGSEEYDAWKKDGLCCDCRNAFSIHDHSGPLRNPSINPVMHGFPSPSGVCAEDSNHSPVAVHTLNTVEREVPSLSAATGH